mmetsp:Transcript_10377/g.26336  ORF Transcript_10377/g.26336 Transcript_10377/m.26336 type:complete len:203 (-) Transcript_10377:643-1251(-)
MLYISFGMLLSLQGCADASAWSRWLVCAHFSRTPAAFPERCTSCAMAIPSAGEAANSAVARAKPALRQSASATGPRPPPKTSRSICALTLASPPLRSLSSHAAMPRSRGETVYCFTPRGVTSITSAGPAGVSSSMPIEFTTSAFVYPNFASDSAISRWISCEYTPTNAYGTCAGLSMGPKMLNAVRTLSAFLTGTTAFMAGW